MLALDYIRTNIDTVKANTARRAVSVDIDLFLQLDVAKRDLQQRIDDLRAVRNEVSGGGKPSIEDIARMKKLGEEIAALENELAGVLDQHKHLHMQIPNLTHEAVPDGGEEDFALVETRGTAPALAEPKHHDELMTALGILDFDRGAKVAGSKQYYRLNDLVRLDFALNQLALRILAEHGFTTVVETPDMARIDILEGAGFNPRGDEDQIYDIARTDLALIGTAEITMLGYHANEVLDLKEPKKYVALSHCFRKEGGAYGRTSKGLYRVHQFSKLEMFIFCRPEQSESLHQELLEIEKEICDALELHYRVIDVAAADLGGPAYRKFDIEAWMAMKDGDFGEITSTSNCLDYQARRLNIKFVDADGNKAFCHTLNGTAVVSSRFPVALFEQHQQEDGSIRIPKALQPFMGKEQISHEH